MSNIDAFLIDFVTINFEIDSNIAKELLREFQKNCNLDNHDGDFVLDCPVFELGGIFPNYSFLGSL